MDTHHPYDYDTAGPLSPEIQVSVMSVTCQAKRSVSFVIPAIRGSMQGELYLIQELLKFLHRGHFTARAVVPIVKSGEDPGATVQASGLVLLVDIQNQTPEAIVCVHRRCRVVVRQIAANLGLKDNPERWQWLSHLTNGGFARADALGRVKAFIKNGRELFRNGTNATNSVLQYRVGKGGSVEVAEIDFARAHSRPRFAPATINKPHRCRPDNHSRRGK